MSCVLVQKCHGYSSTRWSYSESVKAKNKKYLENLEKVEKHTEAGAPYNAPSGAPFSNKVESLTIQVSLEEFYGFYLNKEGKTCKKVDLLISDFKANTLNELSEGTQLNEICLIIFDAKTMKIMDDLTQIWPLWSWEEEAVVLHNTINAWVKQTKQDYETMKSGSMKPGSFLSSIKDLSDAVEPYVPEDSSTTQTPASSSSQPSVLKPRGE